MEPITEKTIKAVSVSSIALALLSILATLGAVFALLSAINFKAAGNFYALLAMCVLGIAIYYLSFAALSYLCIRKKAKKA